MRFYIERNDKRFCPKKSILGLLKQFVFLQNLFSALGAISFIFFLSSFPLLTRRKTEKKKDQKKEKIEKKGTKKRKNFLRFFPVDPHFIFHKKEFKKEEKKEIFFSISLPFPTPKEEKRVKRRRKEIKEKEKEGNDPFFSFRTKEKWKKKEKKYALSRS